MDLFETLGLGSKPAEDNGCLYELYPSQPGGACWWTPWTCSACAIHSMRVEYRQPEPQGCAVDPKR